MKPSFYNYIFYTESSAYWYNALSGKYFKLTIGLSKKIEAILKDQKRALDLLLPPTILHKLADNGFVVEDNVDELAILRKKHYEAVHSKHYFLVVLPTLNCNYRCWYCIQHHVPSIMKNDIKEALMRHIDYMIDVKGIESLHLDWFGGEPFMFFKQVIVPISQYAIKKCAIKGIPFINGATTNGYFLSANVRKMLADLNFRQFQITLDGDKHSHDKVKFVKGCNSTFEHVLSNIDNILEHNKELIVYLRINYTHETLSTNIVREVNEQIHQNNRSNIVIVPKKVWQEKVDKSFGIVLKAIIDDFANAGYNVSRWSGDSGFVSCYVNQEYYNAINFNGHVVKCTACDDLYATEPKGILRPDGIIEWADNYDVKCQSPTFENDRCLNCKKLPSCMGLCPRDFLGGRTHCKYESVDEDFEENLRDFLIHQFD